eukprot:CAMPEP_0197611722 /NCGR_PEP_ID=MMETSP1326-20131121/55945_1 /TAXON_ID=1155430 /ORGANISM="Genus nov. species nov., Strain RCC2288" /LENGTH=286 /DNA_ID=CAMNT_0043180401 /DNA_START=120 /DNA_END=977 /DNA_ORIENTATION=-
MSSWMKSLRGGFSRGGGSQYTGVGGEDVDAEGNTAPTLLGTNGGRQASSSSGASTGGVTTAEELAAAAQELGGFYGEAYTQLSLALPVSLGMICNRVMGLTSVAFVGHLGPLPLAGAALASTLGNVTGNSVIVGMAGAISTLAGTAYGAKSYATLGHVLQRALLILSIVTVPICAVWLHAEPLLLALGQDPTISQVSAGYLRGLIPGLFVYAWNISTQSYMQSQGITHVSAAAGVVAAILHVPVNLVLIHSLGLGYVGAALATSWSNGVVLAINVGYLCFHPSRRR